jgi:hypothetical protein
MNKFLRMFAGTAFLIALSGCASSLMIEAPSQEIRPPAPNKTKVVFMRTSFVSSAIGAEIFEVNNGQLNFIGALPKGNKIVYETTPGQKVFMAYGTAADFMLGNLQGGKIYYSIVRPNWGTGGMIPTPVRADGTTEFNTRSADFAGWVADTKLIVPNADAKEWFVKEKPRYLEIYARYWAIFQQKSAGQKDERTLHPQDGMLK